MGQESELGFSVLDPRGDPLDRMRYIRNLLEVIKERLPCLHGGGDADLFLGNGGRFYIDVGGHPEWATPECTSPYEAVLYRLAGEAIVGAAVDVVEQRSPEVGEVLVTRTNVDYQSGATWAGHESYLVTSTLGRQSAAIVPHLVSRIVYTGAGGFSTSDVGMTFSVSPRVAHLNQLSSSSSTEDRGIFHTRNEPLASNGYRRMHVLCGENLQCHVADVLRMGTTSLIALLIDRGLNPRLTMAPADPVTAMHRFSDDPECKVVVRLASGRRATALDIQRHHLEHVEKHLASGVLPQWAADLCVLWRDVLNRFETDPDSLFGMLDWKTKEILYRRHVEQEGRFRWGQRLMPTSLRAQLCELDMRYGQVGRRGVHRSLDDAGLLEYSLVSREEVERAVTQPPRGRARARGGAIQDAVKVGTNLASYRCDWTGIVDRAGKRFLDLADPFRDPADGWREFGGKPSVQLRLALRMRAGLVDE
jgi:proteasome accessory factor A